MGNLKHHLQKTMLFTAASDPGGDAYTQAKIDVKDALDIAPPSVLDTTTPSEDRKVWGWKHDPGLPAVITNLQAFNPQMNMVMTVCDRVEVEDVTITLAGTPDAISLPLRPAFVAAKYRLDEGHIKAKSSGWWQLESKTDESLLVLFAYEITASGANGIAPLSLSAIEASGTHFFPAPDVDSGDPDGAPQPSDPANPPDATVPDDSAVPGESVATYVAPTWVVVAFGLTTCKARADFEPGGVLEAGRFYPHVMVACNHALDSARATIQLQRPAKIPPHPNMGDTLAPLLAADANDAHGSPLPLWSNVFDYVVTDPVADIGLIGGGDKDGSGSNWMTVVDPSKGTRTIQGKINREATGHVPDLLSLSDFTKNAAQGEFDNLHIAPPMKFTAKDGTVFDTVKMAPFCVHDCMHTHFRWGNFLKFDLTQAIANIPMVPAGIRKMLGALPKSNHGFVGRQPYAPVEGTPLVPGNQTVKVGLTSASSFRYLGLAAGPIKAATWPVFNHHGSAYALNIPDAAAAIAQTAVQQYASVMSEPFSLPGAVASGLLDVDPLGAWPQFYHRLRFTGTSTGPFTERVHILDLAGCRG